ncbi:MAG: hypothetical protein K2M17_00295 [Bacilli bacterium]|nr:hypothetical protein [Bacilli bacterium]
MTLYADENYYLTDFEGKKIPKEDVEKKLKLAQEKIDSITYNRIVKMGFENLTEFQKEKVKKAICYQAEYIFTNGYNNENNSNVTSYGVLDISISVKEKDIKEKTIAEKKNMSEIAYDLIHKTGLDSPIL